MEEEMNLIANENGEFELFEPYKTVTFMTEEDYEAYNQIIQNYVIYKEKIEQLRALSKMDSFELNGNELKYGIKYALEYLENGAIDNII